MPLQAKREICGAGHAERLDDAVGCTRLDCQIFAQRFYSLPMQ